MQTSPSFGDRPRGNRPTRLTYGREQNSLHLGLSVTAGAPSVLTNRSPVPTEAVSSACAVPPERIELSFALDALPTTWIVSSPGKT